jgi:hypothetical protein
MFTPVAGCWLLVAGNETFAPQPQPSDINHLPGTSNKLPIS